ILIATVIMLVFEVIRIDLVALACMLALGWTGVLTPSEVFSGFSSNAVIAMLAVMVLGEGIARTGAMDQFSRGVLQRVGTSKTKVIGLMSLAVGLLSAFIQNIGAAALFLPGILNIARRGKLSASELIMPIGFAAILGGTLTMVGSGPMILINDLLRNAGLAPYALFSVTPVGLLLLLSGIGFFLLFGKFVLPQARTPSETISDQDRLVDALHLPHHIRHYTIPPGSPLVGRTREQAGCWHSHNVHILAVTQGSEALYSPWRETQFAAGQEVALLGTEDDVTKFAATQGLIPLVRTPRLTGLTDPDRAGFAEVVIPPRSELVGRTIRQFSLRRRYAVEPVVLFSRGEELRADFSDHEIVPGDTAVVYGLWEHIGELAEDPAFVVTTPFVTEKKDRSKIWVALLCFLGAIVLVLAGAPIAMSFLSGAIVMVLAHVLTIEEAYQAVEWKVVFLVAGLIPLGIAMQKTGTAAFLASQVMALVSGGHPIWIVLAVAVLSTLFSLVMSNVGAITVLAPLVISIAQMAGLDARPLALMAAVCAANSFVLPTHQVNALLMSAGGYRNKDYVRAGGGMTVLFLLVVVVVFYWFYL
ncbi:MAG: SLC13 family permease, partial [Chloroflexi bacterium]|nr:SLC13 family permease [Chloroflexota bacterium]